MTERVARAPAKGVFLAASWRVRGIWLVAAAAVVIVLPHIFDSRTNLILLTLMGINIVFALSYNMLLGQSGMLSFGHAVYFGFGGFFTVHAMRLIGEGSLVFPVILLPLAGGAAGLAVGIIIGSFSTRRAGTVFAMISLGVVELIGAMALFISFFGGEEGIKADRTDGPDVFGLSLGPQIQIYYLVAVWALICVLLMYAITRTPLGRMANAVRDNFERAEFVGYNPQRVRFIMFALSGAFAGIAGGLFAIHFEILQAANVGLQASGTVLLMTFVGGVGHFFGPILGALLVTFLDFKLSDFSQAWLLYFGLFFIFMVMFVPSGLAGLIVKHQAVWRARLIHRLLPAYAIAAVPAVVFLAGTIGLVEMLYFLSTRSTVETVTEVFGITFDALTPWPWLFAAALAAGGGYALSRALPVVRNAWDAANHEALTKLQQ